MASWGELLELILERTEAAVIFNASRPRPELEALAEAHGERVHLLRQAKVPEPDRLALALLGAW